MIQLPNLVSGVDSKPPVVAPNKAGKTTITEAVAPVKPVAPTVPIQHSEGLANLIPSSSGLPNDPQSASARVESAPLPRVFLPPYSQDGSGHIFRNIKGMPKALIATVQPDCKMAELQAMVAGLLEFESKVPPPTAKE
jgi:hypothetical protein